MAKDSRSNPQPFWRTIEESFFWKCIISLLMKQANSQRHFICRASDFLICFFGLFFRLFHVLSWKHVKWNMLCSETATCWFKYGDLIMCPSLQFNVFLKQNMWTKIVPQLWIKHSICKCTWGRESSSAYLLCKLLYYTCPRHGYFGSKIQADKCRGVSSFFLNRFIIVDLLQCDQEGHSTFGVSILLLQV